MISTNSLNTRLFLTVMVLLLTLGCLYLNAPQAVDQEIKTGKTAPRFTDFSSPIQGEGHHLWLPAAPWGNQESISTLFTAGWH